MASSFARYSFNLAGSVTPEAIRQASENEVESSLPSAASAKSLSSSSLSATGLPAGSSSLPMIGSAFSGGTWNGYGFGAGGAAAADAVQTRATARLASRVRMADL